MSTFQDIHDLLENFATFDNFTSDDREETTIQYTDEDTGHIHTLVSNQHTVHVTINKGGELVHIIMWLA